MFEIGKITDDQLRVLSARMFAGAPGRRYWTIAGPHQESHYVTDRDRKFVQILDQEHAKATFSTYTTESSKSEGSQSTLAGDHSTIAALALGIAGGAVLSGAVAVARHRSNRTS